MRRALPYVVSLLLGVCAALLAACAGDTKGGIPAASAGDLKSQLEDVRERVDRGRCDELNDQLRQIDERIDALPGTVDEQLKQALREGVTRLRATAPDECNDNDTPTQTTEPPPVVTETEPPATTATTPTTPTTELPPPAETTEVPPGDPPTTEPQTPEPAPVEPPPPPPPPVNPGGGTPPEIP